LYKYSSKIGSVELRLVIELYHIECSAVKVTFLTWNRFKDWTTVVQLATKLWFTFLLHCYVISIYCDFCYSRQIL